MIVTVKFTQDDLNVLAELLDAGVKAAGLPSVKPVANILAKIEAAVAEANALKQN